MKTNNKAVPVVYLILEKDNKILFGRRCNTGYNEIGLDFLKKNGFYKL